MPELPEVENVRIGLNKFLRKSKSSNRILKIECLRSRVRNEIPQQKINSLLGEVLMPIRRRGKYLLFPTLKGALLNHLGMTGSWRMSVYSERKAKEQNKKHDHLKITLDGRKVLIFNDPRRFGIIDFVENKLDKESPWLRHLGIEPLSVEFCSKSFWSLVSKKKSPIKNVLLDQSCVVGIGNIYSSEILFQAGVRPQRVSRLLSLAECDKIVEATKLILAMAIQSGGSTIQSYKNAEGKPGDYAQNFKVYGRNGLSCLSCSKKIRKENMSGRSTYWCPRCQK